MDHLTHEERTALRAATEALTTIRQLTSRGPVDDTTRAVIHDLADAFHNIPEHCAGEPEQRAANSFLLKSGIEQAQINYRHHGLKSRILPPLSLVVARPAAPPQNQSDLMKQYGHLPARMFSQLFKPTGKVVLGEDTPRRVVQPDNKEQP